MNVAAADKLTYEYLREISSTTGLALPELWEMIFIKQCRILKGKVNPGIEIKSKKFDTYIGAMHALSVLRNLLDISEQILEETNNTDVDMEFDRLIKADESCLEDEDPIAVKDSSIAATLELLKGELRSHVNLENKFIFDVDSGKFTNVPQIDQHVEEDLEDGWTDENPWAKIDVSTIRINKAKSDI